MFFYLAIVGNDGPLMLACSKAHVSGEYTISGAAFSTAFFSFPLVCNLYKRVQGVGFLSH